jgi:hypothetical protein
MIEEKHPSLFRIIQTDYVSFLAVMLPVFMWGFFAYDCFRGVETTSNFLFILVGITVVALIVLLWRVITIFRAYNEGQESLAIVNKVSFFRGRGRITYVHNYQGEKYISSNVVMKNSSNEEICYWRSSYSAGR